MGGYLSSPAPTSPLPSPLPSPPPLPLPLPVDLKPQLWNEHRYLVGEEANGVVEVVLWPLKGHYPAHWWNIVTKNVIRFKRGRLTDRGLVSITGTRDLGTPARAKVFAMIEEQIKGEGIVVCSGSRMYMGRVLP
jgi:hypothetical protein